ncbi:flavodoxin family protein [Streptomyces diastatochromogenes]|uniref:flavodoxin family protein n=1 Tax=Streptomyces diastatochromogenes TaxID=42236 RepID=UPI0036591A69
MKPLVTNWTIKASTEPSTAVALASVVAARLDELNVETVFARAVDPVLAPGVGTDPGEGDEWPAVHDRLLDSEIPAIASPARLGQPSSVAQRVPERMDAVISETDDEDRPAACDRVVVVTGNEDGAHHGISEISGALADIGCTIPWRLGAGPGPGYLEDERGRDWVHSTGRTMADNLCGVARALAAPPLKPSG